MGNSLIKDFQKRESHRQRKKTIILIIPILIVIVIVALIGIFNRPAPTCFDNKKNGNEEGIDCGGNCIECGIKYATPIKIVSGNTVSDGEILAIGDKLSEAIIKIQNVNSGYGAKFNYKIFLYDQLGEKLDEFSGSSYIFPASVKYLVEPKINYNISDIAKIKVDFSDVEWFVFDKSASDIFSVSDKKITVLSALETGYLEVSGKITNKTSHSFDKVNMQILLYSKTGRLLHIANTVVSNVVANDSARVFSYRGFPYFSGFSELDLNRVEIIIDALFE